LKLADLHGVELLAWIHLILDQGHLTLWELNELWLLLVLKVANRIDRLIDRATSAMARLEAARLLVLEVAHGRLLESLLIGLLCGLVAPIALKVARGVSVVSERAVAPGKVIVLCGG
jgi:hypothetical protein